MLLDLLLPQRCTGCGREGEAFCAGCSAGLRRLAQPLCSTCGAPTAYPVARCSECARRRLGFSLARAAVAYEGAAVSLVRSWKEHGRRGLAGVAASIMTSALDPPDADLLTFVPPVRERQLWRGHHPAEELARSLAAAWGLPLAPLLHRSVPFSPRQQGLGARERRQNASRAYIASPVTAASICLVDDVFTTGATVIAGARALRIAGARRVVVTTFARALRDRAPPRGARAAIRDHRRLESRRRRRRCCDFR